MRCEKLNESALLRTLQRGASGEAAAGGGVENAARAMGAAALQNGKILGTAQAVSISHPAAGAHVQGPVMAHRQHAGHRCSSF